MTSNDQRLAARYALLRADNERLQKLSRDLERDARKAGSQLLQAEAKIQRLESALQRIKSFGQFVLTDNDAYAMQRIAREALGRKD